MAKYQNVQAVINKIRTDVRQNSFLESTAVPLYYSNETDVRRTLELLNATNDLDLQTKLFSILSASLMLNKDANFELIIKYNAVYDSVNNVLAKGLPRKAAHALNFLSTLLYVDAEEDGPTKRRSLALYVKNMTRISGCLAAMSDMFTNSMMYHETWIALCQCLTAACGGSELNQSYCTHLIPACIQRCNQTNLEIYLFLQSLLQNHKRNMELFLNSNGITIFTRELLHYDKCLQLLITVVQSPSAPSLLRQAKVLNDLRDFLRLYGPKSQIGQKAVIILNHIELLSRGSYHQINEAVEENISKLIESKDDVIGVAQKYEYSKQDELDDTATLMQNINKEVFNLKHNQLTHLKKVSHKVDVGSLILSSSNTILNSVRQNRETRITNTWNKTNKLTDQQRAPRPQRDNDAELSFSFLFQNNHSFSRRDRIHTIDRSKMFNNQKTSTERAVRTQLFANTENDFPDLYRTTSREKSKDSRDFRPMFTSTPIYKEESNINNNSNITLGTSNYSTLSHTLQRTRKVVQRRATRTPRNNDKNVRNKSLSSRFFTAINESCTTFVKTVSNIFKKNEPSHFPKNRTETHASRAEISYSFLNYMQRKDADVNKLKKTRNKNYTDFSFATDSCDTCDTMTLKKKLSRNDHLKQTIKKLKMGINLYGCDFKKISRTMWPRESYMTPAVLYDLYRKLLLK